MSAQWDSHMGAAGSDTKMDDVANTTVHCCQVTMHVEKSLSVVVGLVYYETQLQRGTTH